MPDQRKKRKYRFCIVEERVIIMNNENYIIVGNEECISFDYYINRLFEIIYECNHENYMGEVIIPLLRSCCIENTKIVPVYDDRATGPKTENETEIKKRMKTICAPKENGEYAVPDYIFVPKEYSFWKPMKPYLMVEAKKPTLLKDGIYYRDLKDQLLENKQQLEAEIQAFGRGYVVFTDGITWMFLKIENNEIIESKDYKTIRLVNLLDGYYKANKISIKKDARQVDLSFIGADIYDVDVEPKEWEELKETIKTLLEEICKNLK